MKKFLYYSPYIPFFGILISVILIITGKYETTDICLGDRSHHFFLSAFSQAIGMSFIVLYLATC